MPPAATRRWPASRGRCAPASSENLLRYTWRDGGVTQNHDGDKDEFDIVSQAVLFKSKWNLSDDQFLKLTVDYFTEGQDPMRSI